MQFSSFGRGGQISCHSRTSEADVLDSLWYCQNGNPARSRRAFDVQSKGTIQHNYLIYQPESDRSSFGRQRTRRSARSLSWQMHNGTALFHLEGTDEKIVDEFYSGYLYTHGCNGETVSSAEFIKGDLSLSQPPNSTRCERSTSIKWSGFWS